MISDIGLINNRINFLKNQIIIAHLDEDYDKLFEYISILKRLTKWKTDIAFDVAEYSFKNLGIAMSKSTEAIRDFSKFLDDMNKMVLQDKINENVINKIIQDK